MRRLVHLLAFSFIAVSAFAQVQTLGDVSFAVPEGWTYTAGAFGAMTLKADKNFWMMAVYPPWQSSGDATQDLRAAWKGLAPAGPGYPGFPPLPYFDIAHTVGYHGKRAEGSSMNRAFYARLYVLEAGKSFIPVVCMSNDGMVLNAMEHVANAMLGSVRLAPLRASPIKTNITIADMVGHWTSGAGTSIDFYNSSTGQYAGNSTSFYGAGYTIAADGSFTYKMSGMVNNNVAREDDSGVVQFEKEFVVFKGRNHVVRYRFMNIQQAIDGSTVITFLPPAANPATLSYVRDSEMWIRSPRK